MASSSSSSSWGIRTWRTAFLTLRDEALTSSHKSQSKPIPLLLNDLIFSNSHSLLSAAPDLPPHEVTSDCLFLLELAVNSSQQSNDLASLYSHVSHLVHDVCKRERVPLQFNSSSWSFVLDSFSTILQFFLTNAPVPSLLSSNAATISPAIECLHTIRHIVSVHHQKFSLSDNVQLVKFLLRIIQFSHAQLVNFYYSTSNQRSATPSAKRSSKYSGFFEVYTLVFTILGEAFTRVGSSLQADIWLPTIEVLRKVMDVLASKSLLVEDNFMSRFYASLLNCLHLVLMDPKGSILDHVPSFVATLRMFLNYGLTSRPQFTNPESAYKEKELDTTSILSTSEEPVQKNRAPYRPPHLRQKESSNINQPRHQDSFTNDMISSDSECSDSDVSFKSADGIQSSRVRVAAIVCIQDICQSDPKSFTSHWTTLLPTNDVLHPRKFEATLMTSLLFDPYLKARIASASTLAVMLDGPSSVFLQVAEYKESTKRGAFMALSTSLGQILMQLHSGILYLIEHEKHGRLLASLFRILLLLVSATPYSRMPADLLPTVFKSVLLRIKTGFSSRNDQTGLMATSISCLTAALSTSPSSPQVKQLLLEEVSTDVEAERKFDVLFTLFQYSEQLTNSPTCFEALQALRALIHNYPDITFACWEQISTIFSKILRVATPEIPTRTWKGQTEENSGFIGEKVITAAVKVLDEYLRAICGFRGTEDLQDDKLFDTPFTSDCIRAKRVSSAPSYELATGEGLRKEPEVSHSGCEQWSDTIEKHIRPILSHSSAMVRTATVTCFAGITSFIFSSLSEEKQDFIVSSLINAALHDAIPSVRSAACRAIGVISCFPQISQSAEILDKFIHAIEINTHDPLVAVRITASWALANICDSLRHCIDDFPLKESRDSKASSQLITFLTECALCLAKDGDKIKSNAVRALGNLSRFVNYATPYRADGKLAGSFNLSSNNRKELPASCNLQSGDASNPYHPGFVVDPQLLESTVQAFLSCVTTGNVKVQWNVCHALSNLFLNEALNLQDMDWAPSVFSVLLLLLRDSSNFKIRIQAASALAVPASAHDYGNSFSDVIQGLVHILENLGSVQISEPSSFKYRDALEKQVTSTVLHVLSLCSSMDQQPLKDFLVKKAPFLEEWFKGLCSSLGETSVEPEAGNSVVYQKKQMISEAIQSLVVLYESRNLHTIAQKFEKLDSSIL